MSNNAVAAMSGTGASVVLGSDISLDGLKRSAKALFQAPLSGIMSTPDADNFLRLRSPHSEGRATQDVNQSSRSDEESGAVQLTPDAAHSPLTGDPGPAAAAMSTSAEQDRASVAAALRGDQTAFGDLVTRYQSAVYNMAYRMLGDPTEAEDAAQEVFVRAWNQLHTFQLDRRFSTWLLSIASHHCIDMLRRRRPSAPLDDVALYVPSDEPQPDELALRNEQSAAVKRLLDALPDKYRSVTVLRYYNDLSYEEIARVTGLTESAVKTQLHRARKMLAEQLSGPGSNIQCQV